MPIDGRGRKGESCPPSNSAKLGQWGQECKGIMGPREKYVGFGFASLQGSGGKEKLFRKAFDKRIFW